MKGSASRPLTASAVVDTLAALSVPSPIDVAASVGREIRSHTVIRGHDQIRTIADCGS